MSLSLLRTLAVVAALCATGAAAVTPTMTVRGRQFVHPGEDALLTCIVHQPGDLTVTWQRGHPSQVSQVLTAGGSRVSRDPRLQLLHDPGANSRDHEVPGDEVFVLAIKNATVSDADIYTCEINSHPPVRSFHQLSVISTSLEAPLQRPASAAAPGPGHDFQPCCRQRNVTSDCLQLCSLQGLTSGDGLADYARCQADFPNIYHCMADGRDHLSCCEEQGVPGRCSHVCRGEYFLQRDSLRDYISCREVADVIVNCVARGIETLPAAPEDLEVTSASLTSLRVSWTVGQGQMPAPHADWFTVNVTRLRSFDGNKVALLPSNSSELMTSSADATDSREQLFNVSGSSRPSLTVTDLRPLTTYEVSVAAHNSAGSSLASGRVRAVTWVQETGRGQQQPPALPDVRGCCTDGGVTESRCLRTMCDPSRAAAIEYTDLMLCGPWTGTTFSCLTDGRDHSDCCRARGLPPLCVQLCAGRVEHIHHIYMYLPCMVYMSSYSSCLMQGYGVLPSAPMRPRVALDDSEFAVLRWSPPETLAETVLSYTVHVRRLHAQNTSYTTSEGVHSPYLLSRLVPGQEYEFYVTAVNKYGGGAESSRVIFTTLPQSMPEAMAAAESDPDHSVACCRRAGVSESCQYLCNMTGWNNATHQREDNCTQEWHKAVQCGAAGRDHEPCCLRRRVPRACLATCSGRGPVPDSCRTHLDSVRACFAEGRGLLPPPVTGLRATATGSSVTLVWEAADDVPAYQLQFGPLNRTGGIGSDLSSLNQVLNVSGNLARVTDLASNQRYAFTVVALNGNGMSLPASVVIVNTTDSSMASGTTLGAVSAPHSLSASEVNYTGMTLTWAPPTIAPHDAEVTYRLSYHGSNETALENIETVSLSHRLDGLQPDTLYSAFVTAITSHGESQPSEMLETWTLVATPTYAKLPVVNPRKVTEGGSMTVTCDAVGLPVPSVFLYISGVLRNQNRTHHLVTTISNITRTMDQLTCVVENELGAMVEATRFIIIKRRPVVTVGTTDLVLSEGGAASLMCRVDASPEPTMTWRGPRSVQTIAGNDANFNVTQQHMAQEGVYLMELQIKQAGADDFGQYSCHAENDLGADKHEITVTKRPERPNLYELGVAECCQRLNVSSSCRAACAESDVDLEAVLDVPECVAELGKLMSCAADGSDHSACCSARSVPDHCLAWCEGRPTAESPDCIIRYTADVIGCFDEGKAVIPGPPTNIRVQRVNTSDVIISWDPPHRNADKVVIYRLSWRQLQQRSSAHIDTRRTQHAISGLEAGVNYQLTVTAANHHGNSLEASLEFKAGPAGPIAAQSTEADSSIGAGAVLALALVLAVLVLALVLGGVWLVQRRRQKTPAGRHLSFANPTYLRQTGRDGTQEGPVVALTAESSGPDDSASADRQHTTASDDWQEAALQAPIAAGTFDRLNGL